MAHAFKLPSRLESILIMILGIVLYFLSAINEKSQVTLLAFMFIITVGLWVFIVFNSVRNNPPKDKTHTYIDYSFGLIGAIGITMLYILKFTSFWVSGDTMFALFGSDITLNFFRSFIAQGLILMSTVFYSITD